MTATGPTDRPALASDLTRFRHEAAAVRADAQSLAASLDDERFNWRPAPGRWSVAQCLQHLTVTGTESLDTIERLIGAARAAGRPGQPPYRRTALGSWFVRSLEPPVRTRVKTFRRYDPPPAQPKDATASAFLRSVDRLEELIDAAEGLDLGAARARFSMPPVVLTLAQWFELVLAHSRRHLWQAQQVVNDPEFPH